MTAIALRPSAARGRADFGWLDSRHTFSFGDYYDARFMGFSDLRVINEDRVRPAHGFSRHGHRDMEIVSYVVDGGLRHRDTLGNGSVIRPGEIQRMSAGRGVEHSELNASTTDPLHFLQIWLLPAARGGDPGYAQVAFPPSSGLTLLLSPDARDGSLSIGQDVDVHRFTRDAGQDTVALRHRNAWVQVVRGRLQVQAGDAEARLAAGDGAAISVADALTLVADGSTEALVFDLR